MVCGYRPDLLSHPGYLIFRKSLTGSTIAEGLCAVLFWKATVHFQGVNSSTRALVITAFAISIALWTAFSVCVEAFIAFEKVSEGTFQTLLSANLLSLLVICLLPDT
jgi:hypothetical protein